MYLPSAQVFDLLATKGVKTLYHANSVRTACTYLRTGALLARGVVERRGLDQTLQSSDVEDMKYSLWYDVFLDTIDIHAQASRANAYGPVLFEIDLSKLRNCYTGAIWVTKLNPTKWVGKTKEDRWFQSMTELKSDFEVSTFDHMIVLRHIAGELPLGDVLKRIVLDDPETTKETQPVDVHSVGFGALMSARTAGGLNAPIKTRLCKKTCACIQYYKDLEQVKKMFWPK